MQHGAPPTPSRRARGNPSNAWDAKHGNAAVIVLPMPRFAANLSWMYGELPFIGRLAAAARDGFGAVECLFPYEQQAAQLNDERLAHGLQWVLMNAPPGDFAAGDRGLACLPGRDAEFRASVAQGLAYAQALHCPRLHLMAGCVPDGADRAALRLTYLRNLAWAAGQAADRHLDILIEPINARDMPGYFLNRQADAHAVVAEVGAPNLKVQMDLYHCAVVEGDVAAALRLHVPSGRVGHMQIAGVPHRYEPDEGDTALFDLIDALGYQGHIGCEYRPRAGTSAGLGWLRRLTAR